MSRVLKIVTNICRSSFHFPQRPLSFVPNNAYGIKRYFNTTSSLCIKMFLEYENKFAYSLMRDKGYTNIDLDSVQITSDLKQHQFQELMNQDWSKVSVDDLISIFPKLGTFCLENNLCISNNMFDTYIDHLTDNLRLASDEQLVSVFYSLCQWPETASVRTRNFIEVWAALDDACSDRFHRWSYDQMLSFVSLFYMINVTKGTDFFKKALNKLATKANKLTPAQLVPTLFFVGIRRKPPYDMHNLEEHMNRVFESFSVDDLAIMSMGFFKSKTPIRNIDLVTKICNVLMENIETIHEVSLTALLKTIRYSIKVPSQEIMDLVHKILDKVTPEIQRVSMMCNVHITLLSASKLSLHKDSLDAVAMKVMKDPSGLRVKDIERLVLSYGSLNYTPKVEGFFETLVKELMRSEREQEIMTHGRSFACCLSYFSFLDIHPIELINKALSKSFLLHTYGKNPFLYGKEVLTINNNSQIFCKDKIANFLTDKEIHIMAKKYTDYMPDENFKKRFNMMESMTLDVYRILSEVRGGREYLRGDHILSHHQRGDVILCDTPDGVPVPINANHFKHFGILKEPPDSNVWTVLVLCGRNGCLFGTKTPTGVFRVKLNELRKLGYKANLVLWQTYSKLETEQQKLDYLQSVIKTAI